MRVQRALHSFFSLVKWHTVWECGRPAFILCVSVTQYDLWQLFRLRELLDWEIWLPLANYFSIDVPSAWCIDRAKYGKEGVSQYTINPHSQAVNHTPLGGRWRAGFFQLGVDWRAQSQNGLIQNDCHLRGGLKGVLVTSCVCVCVF